MTASSAQHTREAGAAVHTSQKVFIFEKPVGVRGNAGTVVRKNVAEEITKENQPETVWRELGKKMEKRGYLASWHAGLPLSCGSD